MKRKVKIYINRLFVTVRSDEEIYLIHTIDPDCNVLYDKFYKWLNRISFVLGKNETTKIYYNIETDTNKLPSFFNGILELWAEQNGVTLEEDR